VFQHYPEDAGSASRLNIAVDQASEYFLQNRLCLDLDRGRFSTAHYTRLLSALYQQVEAGPASFAVAAAVCEPSQQTLRRYLLKHVHEKKAHADWIAADLSAFGLSPPVKGWPAPSVAAYIAYNHYVAQRKPLGRLAIALMLATLGARLGSLYVHKLRKTLALSGDQLTFFSRHSSSQREHVSELAETIDANAGSRDWKYLAYTARTAGLLYCAIYDDIEL
jgi:hypothetical protein